MRRVERGADRRHGVYPRMLSGDGFGVLVVVCCDDDGCRYVREEPEEVSR
jgi:hypothetical protein